MSSPSVPPRSKSFRKRNHVSAKTAAHSDNVVATAESRTSSSVSPESGKLPSSTSTGNDESGATGRDNYGMGGLGMGGMGMGGLGMGMGGYGMGMGGYGMGGYGMGMGGYGMGGDGGLMAPLMNQLFMVQSLNYTLMSFGHIVQSLGINAGSILQFGQNILRTLDSLAIAIKKSGILSSSSSSSRTGETISTYQQNQQQRIRRRRRAVLIRWALVVLTMAITSQVMRILQFFSNSSLPSALAQQVFQFFRSFFTADQRTIPPHNTTTGNARAPAPALIKD